MGILSHLLYTREAFGEIIVIIMQLLGISLHHAWQKVLSCTISFSHCNTRWEYVLLASTLYRSRNKDSESK